MLFYSLLNFAAEALALAGPAPGAATLTVNEINDQREAVISTYGFPDTFDLLVMTNKDVNNPNGWVPQYRYPVKKNGAENVYAPIPEELMKDGNHIAFMYRDPNNNQVYSRPYTFDKTTMTWAPSRSDEKERELAVAAGINPDQVKYTTENLDKKQNPTDPKKRQKTNSAISNFGSFAIMAGIASYFL